MEVPQHSEYEYYSEKIYELGKKVSHIAFYKPYVPLHVTKVVLEEEDQFYTQACEDDPSGKTCGRCGGENRFYDNMGWCGVVVQEDNYVVVCKECWNSCEDLTKSDDRSNPHDAVRQDS